MKWEKCGIKRSNMNSAFVWLHSLSRVVAQARHTLSIVHNFFKKSPTKYMQSSLALIERCTVFIGECAWRKRSCNENEYQWVNQGFVRVQWQADVPIWTYRAWIVAQGHFSIYITGVICLLDAWCNLCMNSQTKFQHILVFFFRCSSLHHFSVLLGFPFVLFSFQINWVTFTNLLQNDFVHA